MMDEIEFLGKSRSEKILENALGASHELEPPKSRIEALLMELIGGLLPSGTVFRLLGEVVTTDELPDSGNELGDIWYVSEKSVGYIWMSNENNPNGYWEPIGETTDWSSISNIFYPVVYSQTSYGSVAAAIELGKIPYCTFTPEGSDSKIYLFCEITRTSPRGSSIGFTSFINGNGTYYRVSINSRSSWGTVSEYQITFKKEAVPFSIICSNEYGTWTFLNIDSWNAGDAVGYSSAFLVIEDYSSGSLQSFVLELSPDNVADFNGRNLILKFKGTAVIIDQQNNYIPTIVTAVIKTDAETNCLLEYSFTSLQEKLAFDSTPTQNSINPVTSGGVYDAIIGAIEEAY